MHLGGMVGLGTHYGVTMGTGSTGWCRACAWFIQFIFSPRRDRVEGSSIVWRREAFTQYG